MINTMSKEIYESKVNKDAVKRFRMLCEYTFGLQEDDGEEAPEQNAEEPQNMPNTGEEAPDMSGDMGQSPDMNAGMEPNIGDEAPDMNTEMGVDNGGAPGFNPQEGAGSENPDIDGGMNMEPMQPEDEVIDIDELTDSQEETEEKVDDIHVTMEKGFEKLLKIIGRLDKMIDDSTNNMEQIKQEIERRNPTPLEKLNMRAVNDSYPFNIKPDDYWKEKEATSNYRIGGEDEPDSAQYTITQGDIDDITDFKRISQELSSSGFNQNLMNIFGLK